LDRSKLPKKFFAKSIRYSRAPEDQTSSGCELFPLGSFFPLNSHITFQRKKNWKMHKHLALEAPKYRVLYLSRGSKDNSIRWLDNEPLLLKEWKKFCKTHDCIVEVIPHIKTAVEDQNAGDKTVGILFILFIYLFIFSVCL
jgi:hypothetical protein